MKSLFKSFIFGSLLALAGAAFAQEAPDALIERLSRQVIETAKTDASIQGGDRKRIQEVVEKNVLPHIDFQRTTALAVGRHWREATPEQRQQLSNEFLKLLMYTYSGAMAQIKDQKLEVRPLRANPADDDVIVRSQVLRPRAEPVEVNYRMVKSPDGWKIYDVSVLGAWLVETYKSSFATEIGKSGIDGLIKTLSERNQKLAAATARG